MVMSNVLGQHCMNQAGGGGCFTRGMAGVSSDRRIHRRAGLLPTLPLELGLQVWVTNPAQLCGFGDSDQHKQQHLSLSSICSGVCGDEHAPGGTALFLSQPPPRASLLLPFLQPAQGHTSVALVGVRVCLWNVLAASHGPCHFATLTHGTESPENPQKALQHPRK